MPTDHGPSPAALAELRALVRATRAHLAALAAAAGIDPARRRGGDRIHSVLPRSVSRTPATGGNTPEAQAAQKDPGRDRINPVPTRARENRPAPENGSDRGAPQAAEELRMLREELGDCTRCKLHPNRTHIVFGVGSAAARLMFVGEAPGEDEDRQGEPFVGKAGQLLTRMIEAMGLSRSQVYIANILKCRPPGNRNPEADEVETCSPFLRRQIAIIQPRVVCCLGNFASQTVTGSVQRISALRGRFHPLAPSIAQALPAAAPAVKVMPTFHPAYLLRSPGDKKLVWQDLCQVMTELGIAPPTEAAE